MKNTSKIHSFYIIMSNFWGLEQILLLQFYAQKMQIKFKSKYIKINYKK